MATWLGLPVVEEFKGLLLRKLPLNKAYVITNTSLEGVGIYGVKDDCHNCALDLVKRLNPGEEAAWQVDSGIQSTWRIMNSAYREQLDLADKSGLLCELRPQLGEYGVYRLDIGRCEMETEVEPINSYLPLLLCILFLTISGVSFLCIKYLFKCQEKKKTKEDEGLQIKVNEETENMNGLHMFRGLLMTLIVFLSSGGGGYPLFTQQFGGLSLLDVLFFAYTWSIGVRIPTSMENLNTKGQVKCAVVKRIFYRSFFLVFLGMMIDTTVKENNLPKLWMPLQRLGFAYFIVATAYTLTAKKFEIKSQRTICKAIANVVSLFWCWLLAGVILTVSVILISTMSSFNCQSHLNITDQAIDKPTEQTYNCNNNMTGYANNLFVAMDKPVFINYFYGFGSGLMGLVSTVMYMLIGLKAGVVYLHHDCDSERLKLWTFWGTLFGLGGIIFAGLSQPLNFNLWPISSILHITTLAKFTFCLFYILSEKYKVSCSSNMALGISSMMVLSGNLLFSKSLPFHWQMEFTNHLCYLVQNFWAVFIWAAFARCMSRHRCCFTM